MYSDLQDSIGFIANTDPDLAAAMGWAARRGTSS